MRTGLVGDVSNGICSVIIAKVDLRLRDRLPLEIYNHQASRPLLVL